MGSQWVVVALPLQDKVQKACGFWRQETQQGCSLEAAWLPPASPGVTLTLFPREWSP